MSAPLPVRSVSGLQDCPCGSFKVRGFLRTPAITYETAEDSTRGSHRSPVLSSFPFSSFFPVASVTHSPSSMHYLAFDVSRDRADGALLSPTLQIRERFSIPNTKGEIVSLILQCQKIAPSLIVGAESTGLFICRLSRQANTAMLPVASSIPFSRSNS